ncbi:MAG: class B sortase [Dorea sp.]
MAEKKRHHRGRRRRRKKGGIFSTIILIVAVIVFCVSAFQLFRIFKGYQEGQSEYDHIRKLALTNEDTEEGEDGENDGEDGRFRVNFEELLKINPDTVGWLRFYPGPAQINYPLVQGEDNSLYLNKTFSANDNTVGAIFVNVYNQPDFNDRNTIIYGHRMKDNSMFHDLARYEDKSFWEANPYFYIYTPDGREIVYHIYSAGVVKDTSDTYLTEFASDEEYQEFLNMTRDVAAYDTGIMPDVGDQIVTLSTCTKDSNEDRFVVRGVKESEEIIE